MYCDSDSPFGDFHDNTIDDNELQVYTNENTVEIGLISEIKSLDVLRYLNELLIENKTKIYGISRRKK